MKRRIDDDRFPEWAPFVDAVRRHGPDAGTWCEAWTVRDIVVHQAGNAEELARVLGGHLAGEPVATRGFEEREGPLRALNDADLWDALTERMATLNDVAAAAEGVPADTDVAWTGRTMKVPWFAEHMREELVLHSWDITGDEPAARARLAEPWMTTHSVLAVGRPLLAKGAKQLEPGERIEARLRADGTDDVVVAADPDQVTIGFAEPDGPATLETDAAARVLLLWGRRPADPSRIRSRVGPEILGRVRRLLGGY
ncbi:maleylpyruvate isomerase N-terminal domain-containing protein [Mycobacterium colombiense]|uniref:maleylpyruvate isomerase N-terminal domain-containing protein n=1 Tax=Mycobacterium colombiense TaxID=339268 RepID=UPI00200A35C1|nr:maleylpyruvate isomerase N-terminal domain-containing protein [Mycobacterium colombiense]MCK8646001.1 maleylpyruvate isomerase N-terminal domain-containing protein [Mycobacterium colombiense]